MRWEGYTTPTADVIESYLTEPRNDEVAFDSGRTGELTAAGYLALGTSERADADADDLRFPEEWMTLSAHLLVPHDPRLTTTRIDSALELATALESVSGCITVEPSFADAERLATSGIPARGLSEQRRKERAAHTPGSANLPAELSGPEWGLLLSAQHLERLPLAKLRRSKAFARVEALGKKLAFVAATEDPADALASDFDATLDRCRSVLQPLLMDLSEVELYDD